MGANIRTALIIGFIFFCWIHLFSQEERTANSERETYLLPLENHFRISGNTLLFSMNMTIGDNILITNLTGKKIFAYRHEVDLSKITLPGMSRGVYLVNQIRDGVIIQTDRIVIVGASQ